MGDNRLLGLILVFAPLSLLSFGGGQAIIADMQHQTVNVHGWLSNQQFVDMFAVSRAAPGPSTLIAALIGWQVAGWMGAIVATLAIYVPSSLILYGAASWWQKHRDSPWRGAIERGLLPIAVGLLYAGALAVIEAAHMTVIQIITTLAAGALLTFTKIGPYILMAAAAVLFIALQYV